MDQGSSSEEDCFGLLNQFEDVLQSDPLIDEVGFIHPSQFTMLDKEACQPNNRTSRKFWNQHHKLGISTDILIELCKDAKHVFLAALEEFRCHVNACSDEPQVMNISSEVSCSPRTLESEVMKHSQAVLLLSSDFGTAWNARKLILSKKYQLSAFTEELRLSGLILSNSPKSEPTWSHRRWIIKMISRRFSTPQEIISKESNLVESIGERSKMNYRAWYHRCWLVSYMAIGQVLQELNKSKTWAALHVADSSCFHYRRVRDAYLIGVIVVKLECTSIYLECGRELSPSYVRSWKYKVPRSFSIQYGEVFHAASQLIFFMNVQRLMLRILESVNVKGSNAYDKTEAHKIWMEELDWNKELVERYVGREALWLHRRFLSLNWIMYFAGNHSDVSSETGQINIMNEEVVIFIDNEIHLLESSLTVPDNKFEDFQAQALYAAVYMLWLTKNIPELWRMLEEKLGTEKVKCVLSTIAQERPSFLQHLVSDALEVERH